MNTVLIFLLRNFNNIEDIEERREMGRRYIGIDPVSLEIRGELMKTGYSDQEAMTLLGIKATAWNRRMHDSGMFRAGEIRQLRKLIPDTVCDKISK